jgi:hypothetical protein
MKKLPVIFAVLCILSTCFIISSQTVGPNNGTSQFTTIGGGSGTTTYIAAGANITVTTNGSLYTVAGLSSSNSGIAVLNGFGTNTTIYSPNFLQDVNITSPGITNSIILSYSNSNGSFWYVTTNGNYHSSNALNGSYAAQTNGGFFASGQIQSSSSFLATNTTTQVGSYVDSSGTFNLTDSAGAAVNYYNGIFALINGTYYASNGVLNIFYGTGTDPIQINGTVNNYQEIYMQNLSSGNIASTDIVLGNNLSNGADTNYIVNLGINSSGNNQNNVGGPSDSYLFAGNFSHSLWIGTAGPTNITRFFAGGVSTIGTEVARVTNGQFRVLGHLNIADGGLTHLLMVGADGMATNVTLSGATLAGTTLTVSGGSSGVTGDGVLYPSSFLSTLALSSQTANTLFGVPSGSSAAPSFISASTNINIVSGQGITSTNLFVGLDSGVASGATFLTGTNYTLGPNGSANLSTTEGRYTFVLPVACHIIGYTLNVYGGTISGGPAPVTTQLSINASYASVTSVPGTKFGSSSFLVQSGYTTNIVVSGLNQVATNGSTLCLQFACGSYTSWTSGEVHLSVLCQYP